MTKSKKYIWGLIGNISVGLTIIVLTAIIGAYSSGYRLELKEGKITQSGQISLSFTPKDATALIGQSVYTSSVPLQAQQLSPGHYDIIVQKDGYRSWQKSVELTAGQSIQYDSIVLFYIQPVVDEIANQSDNPILSQLDQVYNYPNISIFKGYELWYGDSLVTRYSTEIVKPSMYPDNQHISFITAGQFHIVDTDGTNDQSLFEISDTSKYVFINNGTSVLVQDAAGTFKIYHIRADSK